MCSAQKCTFWQRGVEPSRRRHARALSVSFERPRSPSWTSPQLTTSAFLESSTSSSYVTHCANATTKPVLARTSTTVPRTRSSFSAFAFTVTHIVKVTGKGAATTLPIPSPSHPCSRRRDRRSKLWKARRTKHPNKESIPIQLSLLILNLEELSYTPIDAHTHLPVLYFVNSTNLDLIQTAHTAPLVLS